MTDRHSLLTFLVEEAHAGLARAQSQEMLGMANLLDEANERMAIRSNILRRQDNHAQLELPLEIKAAA